MLIMLAFILLDVLSGFLRATKTKSLDSAKMRAGFYHKAAYLLVVALGMLVDHAQSTYHLIENDIKLTPLIIAYVIVTEMLSIAENVRAMNPKLQALEVLDFLKDYQAPSHTNKDHKVSSDTVKKS